MSDVDAQPTFVALGIVHGEIVSQNADVIGLKFARRFHGVDETVARILAGAGVQSIAQVADLNIGEHRLVPTNGAIAARNVLFLGVQPIDQFEYEEIRSFSRSLLSILANEMSDAKSIVMT